VNRQFKTVCVVSGEHRGKYRIQPVRVIAGKRSKIADYRESGCRFIVHLGKVFFSPRLGTERQRISKLIKEGEVVGAFFAGVGPYPIVFARNSGMKKAYAIELNPEGYKGMLHNISLNKCREKIEPILGDVKRVVPEMLIGKCDRVAMPMPKGGENFLEEAMLALKPCGGIVHFYRFVEKEGGREWAIAEVEKAAEALGMRAKVLRAEKVRSFSASKEQIVIDFWAEKKAFFPKAFFPQKERLFPKAFCGSKKALRQQPHISQGFLRKQKGFAATAAHFPRLFAEAKRLKIALLQFFVKGIFWWLDGFSIGFFGTSGGRKGHDSAEDLRGARLRAD
jgi:hypothetical protein